MTQKFSASRKRAFLTYLGQSGNQTLSAERARVSRSWVCLHRNSDPGFDAACREAMAVARAMLRDDVATLPPLAPPPNGRGSGPADPRWRWHEGVELVVSGTGGGPSTSSGRTGRRVQIRRANAGGWTPRVEQRFLAVLAGSCNVKAACREVEMWPPAAYNHRKRFPGFARAWDQAVEIGMSELESRINENINHFFDREMPEPAAPIDNITIGDAIRVARMYEKRARERGR